MLTSVNLAEKVGEAGSASARRSLSSEFPETVFSALIFLASLGYLCLFLRYSTLEPDEGIVLQGAERILRGELPYRDFFSFYTPGSFYLVAFLFRAFGDSFVVARMGVAVSGAVCSMVTYAMSRRFCNRGMAIFVALLATATGAAFRFLVLHNPFSTVFCCLCVYAAIRLLETRRQLWAFATGSVASICFLFEQSKGAGLYAGLALGFVLLRLGGRKSLLTKGDAGYLSAGLSWPILLTLAYFGVHHALGETLQDWLWPLRHYTEANHVPYGFQNWSDETRQAIFHTGPIWVRALKVVLVSPDLLVPVLPLVALGVMTYCVWRMYFRGPCPDCEQYVVIGALLSGLLASVVVVRPDVLHFMYLAPVWYIVIAWILASRTQSQLLLALRPYLLAYVIVAFGLLGMALLLAANGNDQRVATRRGGVATGDKETALPYLLAHTTPGSDLLVYPYLPLYNYLTATRSPSRYDYFQPGMNSTPQALEIMGALRANPTPVLFEPWFPEKFANSWPNTRLGAIANDPLSDYVAHNYRVCSMLTSASGWRLHYMVKKEASCP